MSETRYVFSTHETIHYRFPTHTNDLVIDRAHSDASEVFIVVLEPGEAPPLHAHHDTEQIFHVMEGTGMLEIGEVSKRYPVKPGVYPVQAGDIVRIPTHTFHRILCTSAQPMRYLSIDCFVGGKPKDEPTWESHVRAICTQNGWEFEKVKHKA